MKPDVAIHMLSTNGPLHEQLYNISVHRGSTKPFYGQDWEDMGDGYINLLTTPLGTRWFRQPPRFPRQLDLPCDVPRVQR